MDQILLIKVKGRIGSKKLLKTSFFEADSVIRIEIVQAMNYLSLFLQCLTYMVANKTGRTCYQKFHLIVGFGRQDIKYEVVQVTSLRGYIRSPGPYFLS